MSRPPITGKVSETGEHPRISDWIKSAKYFCLCRKGKTVVLPEPKVLSEKRTDKQNRYMWGLYGLLSDYTGYTTDQIHDMMRGLFLFEIVVMGNDEVKVLLSTTKQDTAQLSAYIEKMREWQRENLPECYLPTPDEWKKMEEAEIMEAVSKAMS